MELGIPVMALALSFIVTVILGGLLIPLLRKLKYGQSILEIGPSWHKAKQGTPTMGGLMFIGAIVVAFLIFGFKFYSHGDIMSILALIFSLIFGLIGFADDYIKVVKKRNLGLTVTQKFILQGLTAASYIIFLAIKYNVSTSINIPFLEKQIDLGWWYYILALLVIVYTVNSVNLTDGLDGLAASITVPVSMFFMFAAVRQGASGIAVLSASITGGCLGFLIYNFHPAKVFMGDTGSLFLGGTVVTLAFALNMPVIILIVGFVYLFEAFSVVLQVACFKLTGKRLFKMSPLHHHFELCGWKEVKIVYVFTLVTVVLCIIGYLGITYFYNI